MRCTACEKELYKKETLYTEDKQPFCNNSLTCNEDHPNSVKNILARQGAVEMFTENEFEENLFENLGVSDEMKERIMKIATKPQSIRLSKIDIAHYLVKLQDSDESLDSLSACIRHCVQKTMALEPIGDENTTSPVETPAPKEELPAPKEEEVAEATKDEEDEFTF